MKKLILILVIFFGLWLIVLYQTETMVNKLLNQEKDSIKLRIEKQLSMDISFESVRIDYSKEDYVKFRPRLIFTDFSTRLNTDDLSPVDVDQFEVEIDVWNSIINQSLLIKSIVIDGSDIDFSHQDDSGFLLNNVPIKQLFFFRKPGLKRPSLELKNITSRAIDIENLQKKIGLANILQGDDVNINTNFYWGQIPRKTDITSGNGILNIKVKDGEINTQNRVPGSVLSLFSFSELPKRLLLDFRDVFAEGFIFDRLEADVVFKDNIAYTCNLSIYSSTADVIILGGTNIRERTYNQIVIVQPAISDLLPGGAAMFGGPAAAASVFLLTKILRRPLKDAGLAYYSVNGSWDKPLIEEVKGDEIDLELIDNCSDYLPDVDQKTQSLNN
ncbi:MAG: AsmA-like C-terminal region-containing protein [Gammaproteobacteria bacterium]|nr:AsmA-like C-terminal region-containing protein [Gammaproteobacteria bacterium]